MTKKEIEKIVFRNTELIKQQIEYETILDQPEKDRERDEGWYLNKLTELEIRMDELDKLCFLMTGKYPEDLEKEIID